jgi:hypothetical protein
MKKKTPNQRPKLSRGIILQTAVTIADQEGIHALTMRKLAQELKVEAMSIYHHIANKNTLQDGMINQVFSEIELPSPTDNWKKALRNRAISAHQTLLKHPWAIGLMESGTTPGAATMQHHNAVLGCLRENGFSLVATAHAYSVLDCYIYGFVLTQINLPFKNAEDAKDVAATMMAQMPTNEFPYLQEITIQHALQPGYEYVQEYYIGLDLILDAIEKLRDKP